MMQNVSHAGEPQLKIGRDKFSSHLLPPFPVMNVAVMTMPMPYVGTFVRRLEFESIQRHLGAGKYAP